MTLNGMNTFKAFSSQGSEAFASDLDGLKAYKSTMTFRLCFSF